MVATNGEPGSPFRTPLASHHEVVGHEIELKYAPAADAPLGTRRSCIGVNPGSAPAAAAEAMHAKTSSPSPSPSRPLTPLIRTRYVVSSRLSSRQPIRETLGAVEDVKSQWTQFASSAIQSTSSSLVSLVLPGEPNTTCCMNVPIAADGLEGQYVVEQ